MRLNLPSFILPFHLVCQTKRGLPGEEATAAVAARQRVFNHNMYTVFKDEFRSVGTTIAKRNKFHSTFRPDKST